MSVDVMIVDRPMSSALLDRERLVRPAISDVQRSDSTIAVGSRIYISNYCPFHGLRGTVLAVYVLDDEQPFCVYQVQLDTGTGPLKEPIEFQNDDVELLVPVAATTYHCSALPGERSSSL